METLSGTAGFAFRDGAIRGLDVTALGRLLATGIVDGWGLAEGGAHRAVRLRSRPFAIAQGQATTQDLAHGRAVDRPDRAGHGRPAGAAPVVPPRSAKSRLERRRGERDRARGVRRADPRGRAMGAPAAHIPTSPASSRTRSAPTSGCASVGSGVFGLRRARGRGGARAGAGRRGGAGHRQPAGNSAARRPPAVRSGRVCAGSRRAPPRLSPSPLPSRPSTPPWRRRAGSSISSTATGDA